MIATPTFRTGRRLAERGLEPARASRRAWSALSRATTAAITVGAAALALALGLSAPDVSPVTPARGAQVPAHVVVVVDDRPHPGDGGGGRP